MGSNCQVIFYFCDTITAILVLGDKQCSLLPLFGFSTKSLLRLPTLPSCIQLHIPFTFAYYCKSLSRLHIATNPIPACISPQIPFQLAYSCKSHSRLHITLNSIPACISPQIPFPLAYSCKSHSCCISP